MSTAPVGEYTEQQWSTELQASGIEIKFPTGPFSFGTILPCPNCKTVGFYGARLNTSPEGKILRKYRACKFCGLWQEAWGHIFNERGGEAYRCIHLVCTKCGTYNWTIANRNKACDHCGGKSEVTDWPSDNPGHPFNQYKEVIARMLSESSEQA